MQLISCGGEGRIRISKGTVIVGVFTVTSSNMIDLVVVVGIAEMYLVWRDADDWP